MREQTKAINSSPESVSLLDWTLCDEWHTVVVLCSLLQDSVPMNCDFHALHVVFNVDDDAIILANLNAWPWNHTVDCENTTFDAIGQHALAMAPHGIRGIWSADLTGAVIGKKRFDEVVNRHLIARIPKMLPQVATEHEYLRP